MSDALPPLSRLLDDQSSRWSRGEGQPVEVYLRKYPALRSDRENLLDLIYQEIVLRSRAGEHPTSAEYIRRFPELASEIQAQFEVHAVLGSTVGQASVNTASGAVPSLPPPVAPLAGLPAGLVTGSTLGRHALLEKLGEGGMGAVFKARHTTLDRIDAIKVIRLELLHSPQVLDRFYQEARAAARLNHPNVVAVYDAGLDAGCHYLVLEFVPGKDLGVLLRQKGRFSWSTVCGMMVQVAQGLQHVHERGLVHRDLKPSNLVLADAIRQVKILDLGLACLRTGEGQSGDRLTSLRQVLGTPDYMAPEQAMEARAVDIRADLYSLGCTAYHLLTGKVPYPGGDLFDKILRHRQDEIPSVAQIRDDVPPAVSACIARLMAKNPADRHQTPGELAQELRALLRERTASESATTTPPPLPSSPPPLPIPEPMPKVAPSRRNLLLGLGGAALLAGVGATYLIYRGGTTETPTLPPVGDARPWSSPARAAPANAWKIKASLRPPMPGNLLVAQFNPAGTLLAVSCADHNDPANQPGRVYLLDVAQQTWSQLGEHPQSVAQMAFSPDGRWLAVASGSYNLHTRVPGQLIVWDLQSRRPRPALAVFEQEAVTLLPAPGGTEVLAVSYDSEMALVNWQTGAVRPLKPLDRGLVGGGRGAFSPDGSLLALPCFRGRVTLVETSNWTPVETIEFQPYPDRYIGGVRILAGNQEVVLAASIQQALAQDAEVSIWNREKKSWRKLGEVGPVFVQGVDLAPDQRTLALGTSMGDLQIWDVVAGKQIKPMPTAHRELLWHVAFSPTGQTLASVSNDGFLRLWEPNPAAGG